MLPPPPCRRLRLMVFRKLSRHYWECRDCFLDAWSRSPMPTRSRAIALAQPEIKVMIERGMKELTSESSLPAAWARFIGPADVVVIKINPSVAPACCSSPEIIREIVGGVQSVGVPASNIFIYDRYAYEIDVGSYQALVPPGVHVVGIQDAFSGPAGYDMNVYCQANFLGEWETRSYMAIRVAHGVTKTINVPDIRDHSASGGTVCLKQLGSGMCRNAARC